MRGSSSRIIPPSDLFCPFLAPVLPPDLLRTFACETGPIAPNNSKIVELLDAVR
jgi:hypothetical protein